jgi:hypothetical protein
MDLKGESAAARQNEGVAPSIHQEEVLRCGAVAAAAVEAALDTLNELFGNDNGLPRGHHQSPLSQYPSELHTVLTLAPHISSPQVHTREIIEAKFLLHRH